MTIYNIVDVDIEQSVLGSLLTDNSLLFEIRDEFTNYLRKHGVLPIDIYHFSTKINRAIFAGIKYFLAKNEPFDSLSLVHYFNNDKQIELYIFNLAKKADIDNFKTNVYYLLNSYLCQNSYLVQKKESCFKKFRKNMLKTGFGLIGSGCAIIVVLMIIFIVIGVIIS
ncbi:MAG: DnaB-like helicase N-terminal domain-containing protein [Candidatus Pacearchaeota archaeon]|jgi:hypothetical protein